MRPKGVDGIASLDPDQTAPLGGLSVRKLRNIAVAYEPPRDKTNNVVVRPAKTQISLGIRPV